MMTDPQLAMDPGSWAPSGLSVVIPVYNETRTIGQVLLEVTSALTEVSKEIVIVDVLPAPSDSKQSRGHFERGVEGLMQVVAEVQRRTANVVGYLGEWHSHPRGHSAKASGDDVLQLLNLSQKMAEEGLPFLQLIVGEKDVQVYVGQAL